jgi:AAA domain
MGHLDDCITLIPQHMLDKPMLGAYRKQQSPNGHDPDKTWTACELLTTEFPEPRWAVPGILAEGATLLAGAPKLGKSWMALNIAVAISSGGRALGLVEVKQGPVLYLALEDTPRRLQSRLRMVLGEDQAPSGLHFWTECDPIPDGGAERIAGWLELHRDARMVVIDVLTRIRGRVGDRTDRYQADYHAMAAVKAVADDYSVPVLVPHHTRKAAADDFLETVSGTHGLAGAADAVVVLKRSRGSADAVLQITGRDVEEAEYALRFSPDIGTWTLLEGPAANYEVSDARRQILGVLSDRASATPKEVAEIIERDHEAVKKTLQRMFKDGDVNNDGSGRYSLPPVPGVPCVPGEGHEGREGQGSKDPKRFTR